MGSPKTLKRLIKELEQYFRTYGDMPCYVAMGETITPLTDSAMGSACPDDVDGNNSVSVNIVILCDHAAYQEAQRLNDETETLTDSNYNEE